MMKPLHPSRDEEFALWQKKCILSDQMRMEEVQHCPPHFLRQFHKVFQEMFGCQDLSKLHLNDHGPVETMPPVLYHARIQAKMEKGARGLEKGNRPEGKRIIKAQKKHWRKNQCYQKFLSIYREYVRECILPQFLELDKEIMYQAEPILRVVFPNSVAPAKLHADSEFWHQCNELNYWFPLTDVSGTNSLWSESKPGLGDFHPFDLKGSEGELIRFYGNECKHYTMANSSPVTRVSFDFRIIPARLFTNVTEQHIAACLKHFHDNNAEGNIESEDDDTDSSQVKLWCGGKPRGAKPLLEGEYYLRMQ